MNDDRKTWAQEVYLSFVVAISTLAVIYAVTVAGPAKDMTAAEFVNAYMAALMKPDPVLAKTFVGPDFEIIFSGGHKMKDPNDASAFNSRRYKWVKKRSERTETAAGSSPDETVVYSIGTLIWRMARRYSFRGKPIHRPFRGEERQDRPAV